MKYAFIAVAGLCNWILLQTESTTVRAEEQPSQYKACVNKGLEWLAKQQFTDGHWEASGGQQPVAMTALGGMCFLMEGSTLRDGKYAKGIQRAVSWLVAYHGMSNGMLGNPNLPNAASAYMYGHGYALLFLSCVYGEEDDIEMRSKLNNILTRAVLFTGEAQSIYGGWSYTSTADGNEGGDSSSTVVQMQSLRAARNAGIVVPKEIIDKGIGYLRQTTNDDGGVSYGWHSKGTSRPPLTAAALASACSAGEYGSDFVRKWIRYCQQNILLSDRSRPLTGSQAVREGHDEFMHYYLAQVMYNLGEERYAKLFPYTRPEMRLTWSRYRKSMFDSMLRSQNSDGSWDSGFVGPIYGTVVHLTILQLENGVLPIYQR